MPYNDNTICGIVCCTVFSAEALYLNAFHDNIHNKRRRGVSPIQLVIGNKKETLQCGVTPVILQTDLIEIKSDHMCLIYFPLKAIFYFLGSEFETLRHLHHCMLDFDILCDEDTRSIRSEVRVSLGI